MPATPKSEKSTAAHTAPFFKGLAEMPQLNTQMLTRANEIVSEAAKAIWASEVELVRLEAEEGSKLLFLAKPAGDPGKLAAETFTQWHTSSEKLPESSFQPWREPGYRQGAGIPELLRQINRPFGLPVRGRPQP